MGTHRKITCKCGKEYQLSIVNFEGFEVEAMVCPNCNDETFTVKQTKKMFQLINKYKLFERRRKIIKVGSSYAITIPHGLEEHGWKPGSHVSWTRVSDKVWKIEIE